MHGKHHVEVGVNRVGYTEYQDERKKIIMCDRTWNNYTILICGEELLDLYHFVNLEIFFFDLKLYILIYFPKLIKKICNS